MSLTLAELLSAVTSDEEKAKLLAALAVAKFPITDWEEGAIERTHVEIEAAELADLSAVIPEIARGGFVGLATGDWLTLRASDLYGLTRSPATRTVGFVTLSCSSSAGPYTINPGDIWVEGAGGNRYQNTTGGALNTSGTLIISVSSEFANDSTAGLSYTDGNNTITTLVTPLPGVTVNNPAATFAAVAQTGVGTGTVAPSGSPSGYHMVEVEVTTTGDVGVGAWRRRVDGGSWTSPATIGAFTTTGITCTPSDGSGTPSSFLVGDMYYISCPGSWITTQGHDAESDAALAQRCVERWSSLSEVPTDDCYSLWAKSASGEVTRTKIILDTAIPGKVWVYIAGQAGALSASAISTVQGYIDARAPITDLPVVATVIAVGLEVIATVTCAASMMADAVVEVARRIGLYQNSLAIGGLVRGSELIEQIMASAGVIGVNLATFGIAVSGSPAPPVDDYQLAATKVATLSLVLSWVRA